MAEESCIRFQSAADRQTLWRLWSDPRGLVRWDPDRVEGGLALGQTATFYWDSLGVSVPIEVVEREEGQRLCLRATRPDGSHHDFGVELSDAKGGGTEERLWITGAVSEDELAGTRAGWEIQLAILEAVATHPSLGDRRSFAALGPCMVSSEKLFDRFCKTQTWWTREDIYFMAERLPFSMQTYEGLNLNGEILARADAKEVVLWIQELGGVVRLRSLPLMEGRARLACAMVIRWGDSPAAEAIEASLKAGIERLVGELGRAFNA